MELTAKKERGRMTFFFNGEIDEFRCRTLRGELDREIAAEAPDEVVFDMGGVSFVDSTGLGAIVFCLKSCTEFNGTFKLANLTDKPRMIFEITKAYRIFDIYDSLEEAINAAKE